MTAWRSCEGVYSQVFSPCSNRCVRTNEGVLFAHRTSSAARPMEPAASPLFCSRQTSSWGRTSFLNSQAPLNNIHSLLEDGKALLPRRACGIDCDRGSALTSVRRATFAPALTTPALAALAGSRRSICSTRVRLRRFYRVSGSD